MSGYLPGDQLAPCAEDTAERITAALDRHWPYEFQIWDHNAMHRPGVVRYSGPDLRGALRAGESWAWQPRNRTVRVKDVYGATWAEFNLLWAVKPAIIPPIIL